MSTQNRILERCRFMNRAGLTDEDWDLIWNGPRTRRIMWATEFADDPELKDQLIMVERTVFK